MTFTYLYATIKSNKSKTTRGFDVMLNLSIMPPDSEHIDHFVDDIIEQQKSGVSTHAMFMMTFNPEGTPAVLFFN